MHIRPKAALMLSAIALCVILLSVHTAAAQSSQISGFVWNDKNIDGLYQADEPFFQDVTVTLVKRTGSQEQAAGYMKTGADGRYLFSGLDGGEYKLTVVLPEDASFTTPAEGGSMALPAAGNTGGTGWFTLAQGEISSDKYIIGGSKYNSYLVLYAFEDSNANGGRFSTEPMLKGIVVDLLYDVGGVPVTIASQTTDAEGTAAFRALTPAEYRVSVTLPENYAIGPIGQKFNTFYNCIPPAEGNSGVSNPFLVPAKGSIGMAVGAVKTGIVQGMLWFDKNLNGKRDSGETGYQDAAVLLESPSMNIVRTAAPSPDGTYAFTRVQPGAYQLSVRLPDNAMFTLPGGDSLFTDASFVQATDVSVTMENTTQIQAIGVMPVTSLLLNAFHDMDFNGVKDEGDPVFAGAKVTVIRNGVTVAEAVTDEAGIALIPVIRGGSATLRCVLPDGQVFSVENKAESGYLWALSATSDLSLPIEIPDAVQTILKAGVTLPSSIAGQVFEDINNNGVLDAGESFMAGITVQAVNADGIPVGETATDAQGRYLLGGLLPEAHTIRFSLIDPYIFSIYSATGAAIENAVISQTPAYGDTMVIALQPGQNADSINAGMFRAGVVSGYVRLDANQNDLASAQGGLANVQVVLLDQSGAPVADYARGTSDDTGFYYIKGVLQGTYSLLYTLPDNAAFSFPLLDDPSYRSEEFVIAGGADKTMPSLGAVLTGSIAGMVWQDTNANGLKETGETGLSGAAIAAVSERSGQAVNALSQSDGSYILPTMRPGTYTLTVELPEGMVFTDTENAPVPSSASNTSQAIVPLAMGQSRTNADIGAAAAASMDGILFYDADNNAAYDDGEAAISGLAITLASARHTIEITTGSDGRFSIPAIIPGAYVLYVKTDTDCILSDGINGELSDARWAIPVLLENGESMRDFPVGVVRYANLQGSVWSMDGSASGVSARHIMLYSAADSASPVMDTVTGDDGAYKFSDLKPGMYYIVMEIPDVFRFAREADAKLRSSLILSDMVGAGGNGSSAYFDVSMGEHITGYDIGIGALGKLGDTAWLDENKNGMQDGGEPGMPGIVVSLYQYGTLSAQTTTDLYGRYLFTGLFPGTYDVTVAMQSELKTTIRQSVFPLVASILPEGMEISATAQVLVPSGGRNMNCDFGFVLKIEGRYPAVMDQIPVMDWSPINNK
jgi:protocatechuate 3,4-dioxygenase beta subunit